MLCGVNELVPKAGDMTSPYVHGASVVMLYWKCFKHIRKKVRQDESQRPLVPGLLIPLQQFPSAFKPRSLLNCVKSNLKTPELETLNRQKIYF